jgi:hypothetical protein
MLFCNQLLKLKINSNKKHEVNKLQVLKFSSSNKFFEINILLVDNI